MPSERAYRVQLWNYGQLKTDYVVIVAYDLDEAFKAAKAYVGPQKLTVMGIELIGDVVAWPQ